MIEYNLNGLMIVVPPDVIIDNMAQTVLMNAKPLPDTGVSVLNDSVFGIAFTSGDPDPDQLLAPKGDGTYESPVTGIPASGDFWVKAKIIFEDPDNPGAPLDPDGVTEKKGPFPVAQVMLVGGTLKAGKYDVGVRVTVGNRVRVMSVAAAAYPNRDREPADGELHPLTPKYGAFQKNDLPLAKGTFPAGSQFWIRAKISLADGVSILARRGPFRVPTK